jgi:hypothetical protein
MVEIPALSYLAWGKLVKTWATGESYFKNDATPIGIEQLPIPHSIEELKAQMRLVGAGALLPPDNVVGLAIVQYTPDTMVVRLPPKARIKAAELGFKQEGPSAYNFPSFYADFINRPLEVDEKFIVHASRIGDYTMSMCG